MPIPMKWIGRGRTRKKVVKRRRGRRKRRSRPETRLQRLLPVHSWPKDFNQKSRRAKPEKGWLGPAFLRPRRPKRRKPPHIQRFLGQRWSRRMLLPPASTC